MVSAVASQQEGPGFESRPFCVELACSPRVCVGFLRVLRFSPTSKDMHSMLLPLPRDQSTGIRTGVGPRALHCGCPLFLTSLGWVKCRGQISPPGLIKYDLCKRVEHILFAKRFSSTSTFLYNKRTEY